ncbi:MAG: HAMP domain-containing histidine kinase [Ruminococcaceae bacterium]|nr:HAMP domain-containing histidine kinase [Oscillospiraceae bacterium]
MDQHELKELTALFALSRDAVLCVHSSKIIYANTAALERFPDCVGQAADKWLPSLIFDGEGDSWVCTLPGDDGPISVSCVQRGEALLLTMPRLERSRSVMPPAALSELRTTAYNLHMAAELMLGRTCDDEKIGTYAAILQHNYYRLLRLTRNLSDTNTLLAGELSIQRQTLEFGALCRRLLDSVRFFTRDRQVELRFENKGSGFLVAGDRERLEQLLLNLLSNALLHTAEGGEICVSLSHRGEQVILSVDDNGSGISESELSALFSVREENLLSGDGAGLGLYVSQGIVRAHGGTMLVESRSGKGTRVRVMLPASRNLSFRDADEFPRGPGLILTELSTVLGRECYDKRYRD